MNVSLTAFGSNITVIIPCLNDGAFIKEAVDSILDQSIIPQKIIIVDDGSEQETKQQLATINHKLVDVIYQSNKGVSAARNKGIEQAKTEWILTLDADDYFETIFIERALDVIRSNKNISIVASYYRRVGDFANSNPIIKPNGGTTKNFLVKNNGVASALFNKKCWEEVNGYDTQFDKGYEDWDFWISVLAKGYKMHVIPEVLFNYRIKATSRDQDALKHHDVELRTKLYNKHKKVYIENIDDFFYKMIITNASLKNTVLKRENSPDFRLGKMILAPFRWLKRGVTKK